jgi:hypothetical protein
MTTPHVHCMSHLPTAHEPPPPSYAGAADDRPAASATRSADRPALPATIGPMSARLPRSATCVIPMSYDGRDHSRPAA